MKKNQQLAWLWTLVPVLAIGNVAAYVWIAANSIPSGAIQAWYPYDAAGELRDVPEGWEVCDGGDLLPDLRDRWLQGVASRAAADKVAARPAPNATTPNGVVAGPDAAGPSSTRLDTTRAWRIVFLIKQ